jgi:uncharacterized protein YhaN
VNKLSRDCSVARARLDNARAVFLDWQRSWGDAVRPLGLDADVSIFRAQEVLSTLERIGRSLDQARDLLRRIDGMRRDTEALGRDVRHIAEQHAPELLQQDPVDAAVRLQEAILKARSTRDERIRIRRNLQERRAQLSAIELDMQQVSEQLGQLFSAAGVGSVEALIKAEVASAEKRSVRQELERLAGRIRELSDGTPLSELLQEARPWQGSVNRLVAEVNDLGDRNNELDEALREAESEAESLRLGLQSYASEDVALARQAAADRASAARESLRQYLVKRAAHVLLERQVERYAERFSGPILARAAELFERITLGKYSRLSVGLGQKVLRCVSGGHEKEVHELSEGARAQLYFVLRIASLESYFEEQGPVPLVFDDLFQSFDDDRATVAFEILAEIAERTQVLYFTHLGRDVEKAHDAIPGERLFSHAIGVV